MPMTRTHTIDELLTRARIRGIVCTEPALQCTMETIARQHMGFSTLERRNTDSCDFRDVACWSAEAALRAAYEAGLQDGYKAGKAGV
jgi:hypothetical protein